MSKAILDKIVAHRLAEIIVMLMDSVYRINVSAKVIMWEMLAR